MRVFNLAEELEKERKKNEELKSRLKATNKILNDMDDIAREYEERINKAIKYFNELEKENNKIIKFEVQHDEYQHIEAETENALINNVKKILKGDNK